MTGAPVGAIAGTRRGPRVRHRLEVVARFAEGRREAAGRAGTAGRSTEHWPREALTRPVAGRDPRRCPRLPASSRPAVRSAAVTVSRWRESSALRGFPGRG